MSENPYQPPTTPCRPNFGSRPWYANWPFDILMLVGLIVVWAFSWWR